MFRRKKTRYRYYFRRGEGLGPRPTWKQGQFSEYDLGPFGMLGSQGWRYIGIINGLQAFEREEKW